MYDLPSLHFGNELLLQRWRAGARPASEGLTGGTRSGVPDRVPEMNKVGVETPTPPFKRTHITHETCCVKNVSNLLILKKKFGLQSSANAGAKIY